MQASGQGRKWGHYTPSPAAFANEMLSSGAEFAPWADTNFHLTNPGSFRILS